MNGLVTCGSADDSLLFDGLIAEREQGVLIQTKEPSPGGH